MRGQVASESQCLCRLDPVKLWPSAPYNHRHISTQPRSYCPTFFFCAQTHSGSHSPAAPSGLFPRQESRCFSCLRWGKKKKKKKSSPGNWVQGRACRPTLRSWDEKREVNKSDRGEGGFSLYSERGAPFSFCSTEPEGGLPRARWPLSRSLLSTCGKVFRAVC